MKDSPSKNKQCVTEEKAALIRSRDTVPKGQLELASKSPLSWLAHTSIFSPTDWLFPSTADSKIGC